MSRILKCALVACCLMVTSWAAAEDRKEGDEEFTDERFVAKALAGNTAEIKLGELAQEQAADPEVKRFAKHLVADHTKAKKKLQALAGDTRSGAAGGLDKKAKEKAQRLSKLEGRQFDREYLECMLESHKKSIALHEKAAKHARNEELRGFAAETLPVIRKHLKMAEERAGRLQGE
jgi:putative membrane protein